MECCSGGRLPAYYYFRAESLQSFPDLLPICTREILHDWLGRAFHQILRPTQPQTGNPADFFYDCDFTLAGA